MNFVHGTRFGRAGRQAVFAAATLLAVVATTDVGRTDDNGPAPEKQDFPITYADGGYLGISLGFDHQEDDTPIKFDHVMTIDVNRDGFDDMVFHSTARQNMQQHPLPERVFVSNGKTLKDRTKKLFPKSARAVVTRDLHVADFNGDGTPDIFFNNGGTEAVNPFPGERNRILLSKKDGTYRDGTSGLPNIVDDSHGSSIGDFDGDGDIDIFISNIGCGCYTQSYYLQNDGTGAFTVVGSWLNPNGFLPPDSAAVPGSGSFWSQTADIDADGDIDIYASNNHPNFDEMHYLENDGSGHFTFSSHLIPNFPDAEDGGAPEDSERVDIDQDGDDDLVFSGLGNKQYIQILINKGGGIVKDESDRIPDQKPGHDGIPNYSGGERITVVDLDGDGDKDIFMKRFNQDFSGTVAFAYLNDGAGRFSRAPKSKLPDVAPTYHPLDVNGDGLMDFVSDETWSDPWLDDPKNQFRLLIARLDVPVTRTGWATDDRIAGGSKGDEISGLDGDDLLRGNDGNDVIRGGKGNDILIGGRGRDVAYGNGGSDRFDFNADDDLAQCPACDTIADLQTGKDLIDLKDIDAQKGKAGNQKFKFIGRSKFSGAKGELRYVRKSKNVVVQADVDGNRKPDFEILVLKTRKLSASDFVL